MASLILLSEDLLNKAWKQFQTTSINLPSERVNES